MSEHYEVEIISTGAALFSSEYSMFDKESHSFGTLEEAKAFIKDRYGKAKRQKMYQEIKDGGNSNHVGYVYRFRNANWSSYPVERWNQQDWVIIYRTEREIVT